MAHIFASIKESLTSVLPIAIIVLILSVSCVSLLIVKKKFLGEGHKMEFFNTLKSGFKKANKDNEK